MSRWPGMLQNQKQCDRDWEYLEEYNMYDRNNPDYWQARRAFLRSYHFSEQNDGFKGKLKRSVKGLNRSATQVVANVRKEISDRRMGIRVFKIRLAMPSLFFVSVRCFTPWPTKKRFTH